MNDDLIILHQRDSSSAALQEISDSSQLIQLIIDLVNVLKIDLKINSKVEIPSKSCFTASSSFDLKLYAPEFDVRVVRPAPFDTEDTDGE